MILLILWIGLAVYEPSDRPNLVSGSSEFNAGRVVCGAQVKHQFLFSNLSDRTCTVTVLRTACGCTSATLESQTVMPGKAFGLTLEWGTPSDDNLPEDGRMIDTAAWLRIQESNGRQQTIQCRMTARSIPEFCVAPNPIVMQRRIAEFELRRVAMSVEDFKNVEVMQPAMGRLVEHSSDSTRRKFRIDLEANEIRSFVVVMVNGARKSGAFIERRILVKNLTPFENSSIQPRVARCEPDDLICKLRFIDK